MAALLWFAFAAIGLCASPGHAEQSGDAPCAGRLKMFVLLIDKLFARREVNAEAYYEIIRNYLPDTGCSYEEALAISQTSKFFVKPPSFPSQYNGRLADDTIMLKNQDVKVRFSIDTRTGRISYPAVEWTKVFP